MYQNQGNFDDHHEQSGPISWVCPRCQTINHGEYCCSCGKKRKNGNQKFNPWKYVSIALIIILVLMVIGLISGGDSSEEIAVTEPAPAPAATTAAIAAEESPCAKGHNFAKATCDEPKTCKDCGETEGEPLGHDYSPATCDSPARCSRCLKTDGKALSHDWQPATYDSPETCSICGETRGNVKGYYEYLDGDYKSTTASVAGTVSRPWVFDEKVENCKEFTLHYQIVDIDYGKAYGKFSLYYKKSNGKWEKLGSFEVSDKSEVVKTFRFDDPISFKEVAVVAPYRSSFSFSSRLWFDNWYLEE